MACPIYNVLLSIDLLHYMHTPNCKLSLSQTQQKNKQTNKTKQTNFISGHSLMLSVTFSSFHVSKLSFLKTATLDNV